MANLPEQIQRQVDAAESMMQAQQPEVPAADAPTATTPVQATETLQSNVASVQPATSPDDQNSETYAQRWRSLQGIHNATLRRVEGQTSRIVQLEHILSTLQQQPVAQPQQHPSQNVGYLTEKDRTEYADSIDVMRRAAREEIAPIIAHLNQQINSLGQNVSNQVQQVARSTTLTRSEMFYQKLKDLIPNWEQINASNEFQAYLSEVDPQTGIQRQIYLNDAHSQLDVERVAYIFREGAGRQQQAVAPAPVLPQTVTNSAASQLELQVSPGRTRVTSTPVGTQPKQWPRSAISKFYDDYRKGLYRGKEAEYAQIEQDIVAASREGRIVAG